MARIDVVPDGKGKFRVLVNFVQFGAELTDPRLANKAAKEAHKSYYHNHDLNLVNEEVATEEK